MIVASSRQRGVCSVQCFACDVGQVDCLIGQAGGFFSKKAKFLLVCCPLHQLQQCTIVCTLHSPCAEHHSRRWKVHVLLCLTKWLAAFLAMGFSG